MLIVAALAALIGTACESATQTPDDASQYNAIAAAEPTETSETAPTPEPTQTPSSILTLTATPVCGPGEIQVPSYVGNEGNVRLPEPPCIRIPSPTPTPKYQQLDDGLNQIVEVLAQGISARQAASMATHSEGRRVQVKIYLDRDPRSLVIWLVDNDVDVGGANGTWLVKEGEWPVQNEPIDESFGAILLSEYIRGEAELEPPYEGGETIISARVPVSLLINLSQRPEVLRVAEFILIPPVLNRRM